METVYQKILPMYNASRKDCRLIFVHPPERSCGCNQYDNEEMVQCPKCQHWSHAICIGWTQVQHWDGTNCGNCV